MKNNFKGSIILIIAALIWGLAFVAQSGAASLVPPFIFNALRSFIGAGVLYIFSVVTAKDEKFRFFPQKKGTGRWEDTPDPPAECLP